MNQMSSNIDELALDKERLQQDLDKTVIELKRTKIELAMSEERKGESDQCYKNEIKYLIDKLLKTKDKLKKERMGKSARHQQLLEESS